LFIETPYKLNKSHKIYLSPDGEVCNILRTGAIVRIIKIKGAWKQITWRNGKKTGWAMLP
jgi:hypothetical protein